MKLVLFTPLCLRLNELSDQPLTSLSLTFCLCVSVLKPSWNKGLCHRLPGRSAPGVVRPILFLLIDHRPANTTIQHVNRTFKKKKKKKPMKKKQTKNWKKSSNYLLFIVIDRFGDQSTLESVDRNCKSWFENRFSSTCRSNAQNLMSLISTSGRNATIFHFLPLTETKVNWTRPRHQMSSLRSDLIVWFSLIVSLWRSFSRSTVTMIIRMFDVYFIPLLFDLFCSFLELE